MAYVSEEQARKIVIREIKRQRQFEKTKLFFVMYLKRIREKEEKKG